jgi:hypothetical protein
MLTEHLQPRSIRFQQPLHVSSGTVFPAQPPVLLPSCACFSVLESPSAHERIVGSTPLFLPLLFSTIGNHRLHIPSDPHAKCSSCSPIPALAQWGQYRHLPVLISPDAALERCRWRWLTSPVVRIATHLSVRGSLRCSRTVLGRELIPHSFAPGSYCPFGYIILHGQRGSL